MLSVEEIGLRQDDIEQVREQEDVEGDFTTYVVQYGFVGDSYDEAWETLRDGYFYQQRKYQKWAEGEEIDELPAEQREELEERALVGTPADVAEELEEYRDTLGEDVHFVFRPYAPGIDTAELIDCIDRFGEEVAPRL